LGTTNGSGVVGGGQVGCDYQFSGAWVVGVGGQFEAANIRGTSGATPFAGGTFIDSKNPWLNTLTARFGYVVEPATLLYVRGGGAWSRDSLSTFASGAPPVLLATATDNRSGWTVGGGIEHIFLPNVSGFVEYNFIGLGTSTVVGSVPFTGAPFTVGSIRENIQEVLVGLNFRFGGLGGPPGARY
jgi:outer membrane immunogenic protein